MDRSDYNKLWSPAFDTMESFVFLLDKDFNLVRANRSFIKFIGTNEKELIGKKCYSILHGLTKPVQGRPHRRALKTKKFESGEFFDPNIEKWLSVDVTPLFDENNVFIGSVHIASDVTARVELEKALRIKTIAMERTIAAFAISNLEGYLTYTNPQCLKTWGYDGEKDVLGKHIAALFQDKKAVSEMVKSLKTDGSWEGELTAQRKHDATFAVHASTNVVRDEKGRPLCFIGSFLDVTELKRAEEALKESKKQFQDMVETINDWVWEVNAQGQYSYASPRVKDVLGYEPEDILGKTLFDLMPPKEARRVAEIFRQSAAKQKPIVALENINLHKDGHPVFLETSGLPFYDEEGNFKGYRGTDRDVTERKKAASLVEFYREYAENIVMHLPVSLLVVNRELRVNFTNQNFLSKMRATRDDVIGKTLGEVLGKSLIENIALDKKILRIIKREADVIQDKFTFKGKTYDYMISPLKEQTGRRWNAMLVMEDVTEKVIMEENLLHAEKLSAVGKFTAAVVHEINNPLSIVIGNIQYLLSNIGMFDDSAVDKAWARSSLAGIESLYNIKLGGRKRETQDITEALKTANSEARRCAEIVANLLHFSHRGEPTKAELSINAAVKRTMQMMAPQIKVSKVKTVIDLADDLPPVVGNADRLHQVFVNLIMNALQAMKEGGKLHIRTALDGDDVTVSFKDTGPGIPKKYIRRIFEPFYTTKEAGKGTGLGLFIVHSVMEDHRGKIEIQSKRGGGATFILKLPAVKKRGWFGF